MAFASTVVGRLGEREVAEPDKIAIVMRRPLGDEVLSRAEVMGRSRIWADRYRSMGLERDSIVIILIDQRPDLIFAYLGAMMAGCVPTYMPYSSAKQDPVLYRKAHIELFQRIDARAIVTIGTWMDDHGEAFADASFTVVNVDRPSPDRGPAVAFNDDRSAGEADIALLQHSSGTTDLKKGVALSHGSIIAQADAYAEAIGLTAGDVVVSWLPLYHDMGLMACFLLPLLNGIPALLNGIPVVMIDPFVWVRQPQMLLSAIEEFGGTLCWLPNFAFHHLARTCGGGTAYDLSSMRGFIDCSEPCKAATFDEFLIAFGGMGVKAEQLQTCYAMAETTFAVTQSRLGEVTRSLAVDADLMSRTGEVRLTPEGKANFLSVGTVLQGTQVRIVGDDGLQRPEGRMGEITVCSTSLFSAYFRLPEATEAAFRDGWYLTGDLGFILDGALYVTGRKKEMFIVRGRNFFAHEVEAVVNACAGVKPGRAVAIGAFNDGLGSEEVTIVAESETEGAAPRRMLASAVKMALDERMGLQVRSVEIVAPGWLVKTTSGKISRKENLLKYQAHKQGQTQATPSIGSTTK